MADFILVHGGGHGAWCWGLLQAEFARLGHTTHAMDMPVDRPGATIDDYARAVLDAVAGRAADEAYLVGHSMGGLIVPRVATERPKARILFLCAGFAHTSEAELRENYSVLSSVAYTRHLVTDAQGRTSMEAAQAVQAYYHDVPRELAEWAVGKLRPQWAQAHLAAGPIPPYRDRVAGIVNCRDDRILAAEPHAKLARQRFGIEPVMLLGSHSPFLSRPAHLARVLDGIVRADRRARAG
jgi:pimeloyl-ACP methyl ester carboxylesterase